MKATLIFILAVAPLLTTIGQEIPKKANTIIISTSLSKDQLYGRITEILFENGYGILNSDKSIATITTTNKPIKAGAVKLNFLIKDSKVSVRGDLYGISIEINGVTDNGPSIVDFRGMKGSPALNAWNEMQKIADLIPGTKVYLIK
jgi:hypothetical protein